MFGVLGSLIVPIHRFMQNDIMLRPVVILALLLSGCATLTETQCRSGDWQGIGLRDGANGRSSDFFLEHAKACADYGITPDRVAWTAGRAQGLTLYCTPRNAWEQGSEGKLLRPVCENAAALQSAHRRGLRYHHAVQEIRSLQRRIGEIDAEIASLPDGDPMIGPLRSERARLRFDVFSARTDLAANRY